MNLLDEETVCRLCANHGYNYHRIFEPNTMNSIVDKIHKCLPVVINLDDKLPTHICNDCLEALNISDRLRSQCLIADSILRKQLKIAIINDDINGEKNPLYIKNEIKVLDTNSENALIAFKEDINDCHISDWICEFCKDEFKNSDDLFHHKHQQHYTMTESTEIAEVNNNVSNNNNSIEHLVEDSIDIKEHDINFCHTSDWICEICKNEFSSAENLLQHKQEKHDNGKDIEIIEDMEIIEVNDSDDSSEAYEDPISALLEKSFRLEIKSIAEKNKKKNHCYICNITFRNYRLTELHEKFHQPRSMFCTTCAEILPSPYDLYIHKKSIHRKMVAIQMKWFCERCEKMAGYSKYMQKHLRLCEKQKLQCLNCDQEFIHQKQLALHMKSHLGSKPKPDKKIKYYCKQCDLNFSGPLSLRDHKKIHISERLHCKICNKTFSSKSNFYYHKRKHNNIFVYCDHCKGKFSTKTALKTHISMHQAPEDWRYYCKRCNMKFPHYHALMGHWKNDQNAHLYSCDQCGIKLLGTYELEKHKRQKHSNIEETNDSNENECIINL